MKLTDFLKDKPVTELTIARVEATVTDSGEQLAILHLSKTITSVTGSQTIVDDATGAVVKVEAYDVDTVTIHSDDIEDEGFDIEADGTGTYKGNLRLDVAKRTGDVWLKSVSFRASGNAMRKANQSEQKGGLLAKIQQRKEAAAQTAVAPRPTVTAATANVGA